MKTKFCSVLAAATTLAGIIATTGSANAATLTSKASMDYQRTPLSVPLSIQKFDSALGTLNSVEIDFNDYVKGDAAYTNTGLTQAKLRVDLVGDFNLTLNNKELFSSSPAKTFKYTVDPKSTQTFEGLTLTDSQSQTYTDSKFLQSFIGTGNLDFLFSGDAYSGVTGPANNNFSVNTYAKADVNVIYNYDAKPPVKTPEPSALLGVGLVLGFGLLSQRKRTFSKA